MRAFLRGIIFFFKSFVSAFAKVLAFLMAITVFLLFVGFMAGLAESEDSLQASSRQVTLTHESGNASSDNKLVLLPIHGIIMTERATDPLSDWLSSQIVYGYEIKRTLQQLVADDSVKGVLLHIDSPGGTVVGSKAIADGVMEYQEKTGKPVYAYISGMAASGGYWALSGANTVIADTGTTIGSIGVLFGPFKFYDGVVEEDGGAFAGGVVTQRGIETTYITAGTSKDIGNPYRQITPAEQTVLQEGVNDAYDDFVAVVASSRELEEETIRTQVGAMIYGEKQAQALQLIDIIGTKDTAMADLAAAVGLSENDYQLVTPEEELQFLSSLLRALPIGTQKPQVTGCPLASALMAYHGDVSVFCR